MNITHAKMVSQLMKPKAELQFTAEQSDLIHAILGISGECGELLDAVKKHVIYGKELDIINVAEELGDIEFYLQHFRAILGITREETIDANMKKLAVRYPGYEYTDAKAKERADKADDGWIKWIDGDCPVEKTAQVICRMSDGVERKFRAGQICWDKGQTLRVIAYKLA